MLAQEVRLQANDITALFLNPHTAKGGPSRDCGGVIIVSPF